MANIVEQWRAEGRAAEETAAARRKRANAERREARQAAREEKPQAARPKRARKPKPEPKPEVAKPEAVAAETTETTEAPKREREVLGGLAFSDCFCSPVVVEGGGRAAPDAVRDAIISALPAASSDQTRPTFTSVLWARLGEGKHLIVATDTYRLFVEEVEAEVGEYQIAPGVGTYWLLSAAALRQAFPTPRHRQKAALYLYAPRPEDTVAVDYLIVSSHRDLKQLVAPALQIVGQYPNWEKVIPEGPWAWSGEVPGVEKLAAALKSLVGATDDASRVEIIANGRLELRAHDELVSAQASLVCEGSGEAHIALNGVYLRQFLQALIERHGARKTWVQGYIGEPLSPMIWSDLGSRARYILMPMQVM